VKLVLEALTRVEGLSAENQVVKVGDWSGYDELARDEFDGQAQLIPTGKLVAPSVQGFEPSALEQLLTFSMSLFTPTSFSSLPSLFRSSYFGSSGSVPEMDFSPPTLRVMARGLRPCLPRRPPSLISGFDFLFS
jgi:hypothetical protein